MPCTLTRGLSLTREFLVLASGGYQSNVSLVVSGRRSLIGTGTRPTLQNTLTGPVLKISGGADVTIDNLEVFGATSGANGSGHGFEAAFQANVKLTIRRSVVRDNAQCGIEARGATVVATDSTFRDNDDCGVDLVDAIGTFDRCVASGNTTTGLRLDGGVFIVRNTFVFRNGAKGIDIFASAVGNIVEFNTIADNPIGVNCVFSAGQPETPFANNILARNGVNTNGGVVCTYPDSILTSSVAGLNFVSPDAAPFDYHIQSGSTAIDAAGTTTLDHDFDGDPRPGDAADVGADEL